MSFTIPTHSFLPFSARVLYALVALQIVLDAVAFFWPALGTPSQFVWLSGCVALIVTGLCCCIASLIRLSWGGRIAVLWYLALIGVFLVHPSSASHEAAQELACGSNLLAEPNSGIHTSCFLGYPARQYLLAAIPTLLFEPRHAMLNLGGSLPFLIGLGILSYAVAQRIRSSLLQLLILSIPLHFYFFTHFLLMFEQSMWPMSLGCAAVGSYFLATHRNREFWTSILVLICSHIVYGYTPALALMPVSLIAIFLLRPRHWYLWLMVIIGQFATTVLYRSDIRMSNQGEPLGSLVAVGKETLWTIFIGGTPKPFSYLVVVLAVILVVFSFRKLPLIVSTGIAGWMLAVLYFAATSRGYTFYSIEMRLHRATILVPGLITLTMLLSRSMQAIPAKLTFALTVFFVGWGVVFQAQYVARKSQLEFMPYLNTKEFARQLALIEQLNALAPYDAHQPRKLLIHESVGNTFASLQDQIRYYRPRDTTINHVPDCDASQDDATVLVSEVGACSARGILVSFNGEKPLHIHAHSLR